MSSFESVQDQEHAEAEIIERHLSEQEEAAAEAVPNPFFGVFDDPSVEMAAELVALAESAANAGRAAQDAGARCPIPLGPLAVYELSVTIFAGLSHPAYAVDAVRCEALAGFGRALAQTLAEYPDPEVRPLGQLALATWEAFDRGIRLDMSLASPGKMREIIEREEVELSQRLEGKRVRESLRTLGQALADAADTILDHTDTLADVVHGATARQLGPVESAASFRRVREAMAAESVAVHPDSPSNWFAPVRLEDTFPEQDTPVAASVTKDLGATQAIPVIPEDSFRERFLSELPPVTHTGTPPEDRPDHPAFLTKLEGGTKYVSVPCQQVPACEPVWVAYSNGDDLHQQYSEQTMRHMCAVHPPHFGLVGP